MLTSPQTSTSNGVTPELRELRVFDMQGQSTQPFTIPFTREHLDNGIGSPQAYQPPHGQRLSWLAFVP